VRRRTFLGLCLAGVVAACSRGAERRATIDDHVPGEPLYVEEARAYVVDVPPEQVADALLVFPEELHEGIRHGVLALSQVCPAEGCRIGFCASSGWFECGCDGSHFTRLGAWRSGRATRGMDQYRIEIDDGEVVVDTSRRLPGLSRGAFDSTSAPRGPHCVGAA
jgi:cytochrome b6-f complex iron-sulfur subunit